MNEDAIVLAHLNERGERKPRAKDFSKTGRYRNRKTPTGSNRSTLRDEGSSTNGRTPLAAASKKTPLKESPGEGVADQHLVEQYEQLRRQATRGAGNGGQGLGLALFLRSGMAAWMQAWSQCVSGVSASTSSQPTTMTSAPIDVRAQIATLLAGIILNLQQEVTT